jgi:two-component system CheB/CheR fusion protein
VEELETANEELKSSNEEMMSMNEELQSANEELSTVNEEIKNKADQLAVVNDDMRHFLDSTEIALVILDKDFRVRTFTKPILNIYPLQRADRGRPLSEVMSTLNDSHIFDDAEKVLEGHESIERLVTSKNGGVTYSMRILPYRTQSRDIEGVTLTFNDVSSLHSMEDELRIQTSRLRVAMSAAGIGAWNYDPETGETDIDHKVRELFGVPEDGEFSSAQMIDRMHEADRERVRSGLEKAASGGGEWREVFRIPTEEGDVRWIVGQGRMEKTADGQSRMYGVNFDISSERSALAAKELLLGELNHRVKNLFAIISSIVALAGRQYEDTDEMVETVRNRIAALGRAHEATQNDSGYESVMLGELLKTIVAPYAADNDFIFKGSEVSVPTDTVTPIGLIVHEWATNAAKYGALKESEGSVQISWFVTQTDTGSTSLELEWSEEGGPTVSRPEKHEGFGTRLIESSARQLRAEVETEWRESGVLLRMSIPFSEMPSGDRI